MVYKARRETRYYQPSDPSPEELQRTAHSLDRRTEQSPRQRGGTYGGEGGYAGGGNAEAEDRNRNGAR